MTIQTIGGGLFLNPSLKPIELSDRAGLKTMAWLLAAGVLAVVLHELFRWPLRMPGRHGLEWMAILIFARTGSTYRWAATVTAFGAASASLLPLAGAIEPLAAASYWITGVIVDLLYRADKQWRRYAFYLALIAAAAHSVRPVLNWIELFYLGVEHHSLTSGLWYPVSTHFGFGFIGGLAGAVLAGFSQRRHRFFYR